MPAGDNVPARPFVTAQQQQFANWIENENAHGGFREDLFCHYPCSKSSCAAATSLNVRLIMSLQGLITRTPR
jgi:hypothetical protein